MDNIEKEFEKRVLNYKANLIRLRRRSLYVIIFAVLASAVWLFYSIYKVQELDNRLKIGRIKLDTLNVQLRKVRAEIDSIRFLKKAILENLTKKDPDLAEQVTGQAKDSLTAIQRLNRESWEGEWNISVMGKRPFTGTWKVEEISTNNSLTGTFILGDNISGNIQGRLSPTASEMQGTWRNNRGSSGQINLRLDDDRNTFSGLYSMSVDEPPGRNRFNKWEGQKNPTN